MAKYVPHVLICGDVAEFKKIITENYFSTTEN